jgi:hypothetical protein
MPRAMFTLFQMATFEAWADITREAWVWEPALVFFFLAYIGVSALCLVNLIIGVIVENTRTSGQKERLRDENDEQWSARAHLEELRKLIDGDTITTAQLDALVLPGSKVHALLAELEVDESRVQAVLAILGAAGQGVKTEDFLFAIAATAPVASCRAMLEVCISAALNGVTERFNRIEQKVQLLMGDAPGAVLAPRRHFAAAKRAPPSAPPTPPSRWSGMESARRGG